MLFFIRICVQVNVSSVCYCETQSVAVSLHRRCKIFQNIFNYKDRKNSDTFLPASVKLAVTSVLYTISRRSAQPTPETSAAEE